MIDNNKNFNNMTWGQLPLEFRQYMFSYYKDCRESCTNVIRMASDILWNWLFILNSGGLLSVITIFSSSKDQHKLMALCFNMGLCFVCGLFCIYIAVQLEHYRFTKKSNLLDKSFASFQDGKCTLQEFLNNINETAVSTWLITICEIASFIFFVFGLIFGFTIEVNYL